MQDHEWIKIEGDIGTIGITNHAQEQLGDVVFVDLPEVGDKVEKDDTMGAVESVKAASDIYSPVTGEVTAVNDTLSDEPSLVNSAAESDGARSGFWIGPLRTARATKQAPSLRRHPVSDTLYVCLARGRLDDEGQAVRRERARRSDGRGGVRGLLRRVSALSREELVVTAASGWLRANRRGFSCLDGRWRGMWLVQLQLCRQAPPAESPRRESTIAAKKKEAWRLVTRSGPRV